MIETHHNKTGVRQMLLWSELPPHREVIDNHTKLLTTSEICEAQSVRIYINEHGAKVGISNGKLVVSKNGVKLKSLPAEQFE